jgi:hypothetical protein
VHRKDGPIQLTKDGKYLRYTKEFVKFLYTSTDLKDSKRLYIYWEERDPALSDYLKKIDSDFEDKSNLPYKRAKFESEQAGRNKKKKYENQKRAEN